MSKRKKTFISVFSLCLLLFIGFGILLVMASNNTDQLLKRGIKTTATVVRYTPGDKLTLPTVTVIYSRQGSNTPIESTTSWGDPSEPHKTVGIIYDPANPTFFVLAGQDPKLGFLVGGIFLGAVALTDLVVLVVLSRKNF
jgi:hypothetical protein